MSFQKINRATKINISNSMIVFWNELLILEENRILDVRCQFLEKSLNINNNQHLILLKVHPVH